MLVNTFQLPDLLRLELIVDENLGHNPSGELLKLNPKP